MMPIPIVDVSLLAFQPFQRKYISHISNKKHKMHLLLSLKHVLLFCTYKLLITGIILLDCFIRVIVLLEYVTVLLGYVDFSSNFTNLPIQN